ncbi:MAG: 50S ribosomal protein L21 [Thermoproteota archaeon]|jgi:large subunit ribosomal protein L21e|nr:50S ribosomal protein L21 [Thermoproteota archaeon]PWU80965.1 MAG: 50S ribosomal protein L21 [Candidatus Nitrosopolaris wilkensis]
MPSSHGTRRKSRSVLTKRNVSRGISYLLTEYNVGDKVIIDIDPSEHSTTPHRRFQGKVGDVMEVGRRILKVAVLFGSKQKILQTRLNHIKPFNGGKSVKSD